GRKRGAVCFITRDDVHRLQLDDHRLKHELDLEQFSEAQQDALALLRDEAEPPNRDGIWTAWVQALDEEAAAPRLDVDSETSSSVGDANTRAVNALRALCADDAADTRAGNALRTCSQIRRHQQCSHSGWPR